MTTEYTPFEANKYNFVFRHQITQTQKYLFKETSTREIKNHINLYNKETKKKKRYAGW